MQRLWEVECQIRIDGTKGPTRRLQSMTGGCDHLIGEGCISIRFGAEFFPASNCLSGGMVHPRWRPVAGSLDMSTFLTGPHGAAPHPSLARHPGISQEGGGAICSLPTAH